MANRIGTIFFPKDQARLLKDVEKEYVQTITDKEFTEVFSNTFLSWQQVEAQLFLIFNTLLPTKNANLTSAAFHAVMNLDARLAMIGAVAEQQLRVAAPKLLETWTELVDDTRSEARKRNRLAHFSLHRHSGTNRGKTGLRLRPSIYDSRPSGADYGIEELRRFRVAFLKLEEALGKYNDELRKVVPR